MADETKVEELKTYVLPEDLAPEGSNSITNGSTETLIRGQYQSANYSPGESGWKIDSNGNAEFQSIVVSGINFKTNISCSCSAKARFAQASGGNGTIADSSTGINVDSGSGVIGYASIKWAVEASNQADWFRGNPTFSCFIGGFNNATGGGVNSAFVGIGSVTVSAAGGHTFTNSHIGFKLIKTGNVTTLYATQADGTTENASSALTTIANGNILELICVVKSTISVDYYWRKNGGVLSAATRLTSNIPTAKTGYFQFSTSTDNTTTSQTVFDVGSFSYSRSN